jgi:hypothetical protein
MEFASYLAGERWSDHPACTHGTLAHLARLVNDLTSNTARARLTPLIPTVIGLTSDDPLLDVLSRSPRRSVSGRRLWVCTSRSPSSRNTTTWSPLGPVNWRRPP